MVLIASLARAVVVLLTALLPTGTFALDDLTYVRLAKAMAAGDLSNWGPYEHQLSDQTLAFLWPLKSIFQLFGAHIVLGQLYVSLWGIGAAALTTVIATRFLARPAVLISGLVVALLPSEVLWSSLVLKDAAVWAMLALIGLIVLTANRADPSRWGMIAVALVASLFCLAFLRHHTLVVACWSLPAAFWFGRPSTRTVRVLGGLALALLVPVTVGLGIGGWRIATNPDLAQRRSANAQGADSAFVEPGEVGEPGSTDEGGGGSPAPGDTETPGGSESPREPGTATRPVTPDDSFSANITHLPRGLTVMLFEPVPWRRSSSSNVTFARWEMLLWYPLLILAVVGTRFAGRHLSELAFPLLVGLGMLLVYALAEGNIGTAYRHRGEFVWVVALLAALGTQELTNRYRRGRHEVGHDSFDSDSETEGSLSGREPVT